MKKPIAVLSTFILLFIFPVLAEPRETRLSADVPPSFSWRDINGTDFTTPVKNQAPAPTCEAYALIASLETKLQYQVGERYNPDLSEAHLYFYAGGTVAAGYVNIVDAANYLMEHGVPDEGCFPDPHRPFDTPFESLPGWENRTVKISEWGWVEHDEEAMKRALIEHGPLMVCMYFWRDFYYYRGGVYRHRWGRIAGGHVMAIVGYDDSEQCWVIKNSWGTEWGEDGWVRIAYDDLAIAEWYGNGTGVMYIDGVHGNIMPDVPHIQIEKPALYRTYIFGKEYATLFRKLPFIQEGAPRIMGELDVGVNASNTAKVAFYVDGELAYTDFDAPYEWNLEATRGLHTLEVCAYDSNGEISKDVVDIFVFM